MDSFPTVLAVKHEQVARAVERTWGSLQGIKFLEELLSKEQSARLGIDADEHAELQALKALHLLRYPELVARKADQVNTVAADGKVTGQQEDSSREVETGEDESEDSAEHQADAKVGDEDETPRRQFESTGAGALDSKGEKFSSAGAEDAVVATVEAADAGPENQSDKRTAKSAESLEDEAEEHSAMEVETGVESTDNQSKAQAKQMPATAASVGGKLLPWPELTSVAELIDIQKRRLAGEQVPSRDKRQMMDILRQHVALSESDLVVALKRQAAGKKGSKRDPIGKVMVEMGIVSEEMLNRVLCVQYGILMINLKSIDISAETLNLIPHEVAKTQRAVPVTSVEGVLFIAVDNPFGPDRREYFNFLTKQSIELLMAPAEQIADKLLKYQTRPAVEEKKPIAAKPKPKQNTWAKDKNNRGGNDQRDNQIADIDESGLMKVQDDASVIGLVNRVISDAHASGTSDVHIEGYYDDKMSYIRFRRDGRMEQYSHFPASHHRAVVSRIKIMSNLDISERRIAQDGKISFTRPDGEALELRVATIPTSRDIENITIRLLHSGDPLPISALNMCERDMAVFTRLIERPYGLILVCGPTGSGKTTTLHSALSELNTPHRKIWTAEDPVEISQKGVSQVQVNSKIGWTFAAALRSFLRADPDVIMIGEMRDQETATIGVEASMTGHVVLSTLHTNSAAETMSRLLDLDVDPFNLADALLFILAQRLTRKLCSECKEAVPLSPQELQSLVTEYYYSAFKRDPTEEESATIVSDWKKRLLKEEKGELSLWQASGCDHCGGSGYRGRVAVFELMELSPELRELLTQRSPATKYQKLAVDQGMRTLKQDGVEKSLLGLTDMSEVRGACN